MAAKKTGGTGARLKAKNQAMAAHMKTKGITRTTLNCPICHHLISMKSFDSHIMTCTGRR